jgi:hypothetical protein
MSANRLSYDPCSYKQSLYQSVAPVNYTLDPIKYEHSENLVDLENNLRGQTYPSTKCSDYKYKPEQNNKIVAKEYIKPVEHPVLDTRMKHLDSCQMFDYTPVPKEPQMTINRC